VNFEEARAAFPVLERCAYLNAGSVGPLARVTVEAMDEVQKRELKHGRGGRAYFDLMIASRDSLRATLAGLIDVAPEQLALTSSTTDGCNVVLRGLDLGPEDEVVTTDVEHFGLLGPLHTSGARVRVAQVRDRRATEALEPILAEVGPKTRLVALSHVAWTTGQILPVAELRERLSLPLLVDGAQSVGAIPVSAEAFDYYTISGQKWLCGPVPTGGLYVRDAESLRVASPTYFSQASYEHDGSFVPREGAARFDPFWVPIAFAVGLEAAIALAPPWRFERARETAERCRELLAERGVEVVTEPGQATLVTFRPDGDAAEVAARLGEAGVIVRDMPGTGWVRVSCGWWTNEDDLQRLVDGL
jgi:L-cysteine/cystine lyase